MKRTDRAHLQRRCKARRLPLAVFATLGLIGCSSTPEVQPETAPGIGPAVDRAAFELASKAAKRVEISTLRVALHNVADIDGNGTSPLPSRFASNDLSVLTEEVAGEMTIALASNFHLIDLDLMQPITESWRRDGLSPAEMVERSGATHLVVGTISPHEHAVQLNLRLVDAKSYVIVSTARVDLPVHNLSDRSRVALGDIMPVRDRSLTHPKQNQLTLPPEPVPVSEVGVAFAEPLVEEQPPVEAARSTKPVGYEYTPASSVRSTAKALDPHRVGPAAARLAAVGRTIGD